MRARSFSHVGITVSDFNRAVRFYWEVFGCPLVGVADTPPDRVRRFFGVEGEAPGCKIGWIRVPGGGVLEIFAFTPQRPPVPLPPHAVPELYGAEPTTTHEAEFSQPQPSPSGSEAALAHNG